MIKENQEEMSVRDAFLKIVGWTRYLWKKKWTIVAMGIVGAILGIGYSIVRKPIYTATTTFVLENGEKSGGLSQYAGIASMMGIDLSGGGGIFQGENILELYRSRRMIEKALFNDLDTVSKKPLIERYIEINKLRDGWESKPELQRLKFTSDDENENFVVKDPKLNRLRDSIIGSIVGNITKSYLNVTKPDKKLSIIKVDVKSIDEVFAKRFNEELVKEVNDFYVLTKTKKSLGSVSILQYKTDSVIRVMNSSIYSSVAVSDATPNLNPTRQVQRIAPMQKAQFSAEINRAVLSEMVKNLEMSKMALLKETPLIQEIDIPIFPLKKDRVGKMKGMLIGGCFFGFITVLCLILKLIFKNIISGE